TKARKANGGRLRQRRETASAGNGQNFAFDENSPDTARRGRRAGAGDMSFSSRRRPAENNALAEEAMRSLILAAIIISIGLCVNAQAQRRAPLGTKSKIATVRSPEIGQTAIVV